MGDFNSHHSEKRYQMCDGKGKILLHEVNENNLTVINNIEKTFINSDANKNNSAIDLTITSLSLAPNIQRNVSNIHNGNSGHRVIFTNFNLFKSLLQKITVYDKTKLTKKYPVYHTTIILISTQLPRTLIKLF